METQPMQPKQTFEYSLDEKTEVKKHEGPVFNRVYSVKDQMDKTYQILIELNKRLDPILEPMPQNYKESEREVEVPECECLLEVELLSIKNEVDIINKNLSDLLTHLRL